MKLKAVWSDDLDGTKDLRNQFIRHPLTQHKVSISASNAAGSVSLAWLRGQNTGIHDAYRTLKAKYPRIAKELIDAYGMTPDGRLGVG